jgi:hypothetical protein
LLYAFELITHFMNPSLLNILSYWSLIQLLYFMRCISEVIFLKPQKQIKQSKQKNPEQKARDFNV